MSLNGSGVFTYSTSGQPVVSGTLITAAAFNGAMAEIQSALSTALYKDGQQLNAANQAMGGFKLTGLAAGSSAGDSVRYEQVFPTLSALPGRNAIINGNFGINQRGYASGAAVGALLYGHDRWKMAAAGDTYTFATALNVTTVTIPAGKVLQQVIEGVNLQSATYTLSWTGTAQGKIGAGSYGATGITGAAVGGTDLTIEFGPGTVSKVQFEKGSVATTFEDRPIPTELLLCQRYYCKTFNQATAPAQSVGLNTGELTVSVFNAGVSQCNCSWYFPVAMRAAPSTITTYNPSQALATFQNRTQTLGSGAVTVFNTSERGTNLSNAQVAGDAVSDNCCIHASAHAEL
jgi:hypothetical protein